MDKVVVHIDKRLEPFKPKLIREVTRDDIMRLMEIKMQRILKFSKDKADELMARINAELKEIAHDLAHMTEVTINWFKFIKEKYGKDHPRRTEIRNFDTIEAAKVAEANEKLYINRAEGFIGTGLKKDEFVCNCSDIDDVILFYRDGLFKVVRVADKIFVGKNIIHVDIFKRGDNRTIYNMVYRDGKAGAYYMKRFSVPAVTREREYDLTKGTEGSRIVYFTANPNGEAEIIKVALQPSAFRKKLFMEKDFSEISIKGRGAAGRLLTKVPVTRITLKSHGHSTLGGRKVWFDEDVQRLNYDEHGRYLGEFDDDDRILVVLDNGDFYSTNFDVNNHYETNIKVIEKFDPDKVWTALLFDAENNGYLYLKRFTMEAKKNKQNYLGTEEGSREVLLTDQTYPRVRVTFGGNDAFREPMEIEAEEFVGVKGFKAHGKRVSTWDIEGVEELEPLRLSEKESEEMPDEEESESDENAAEETPKPTETKESKHNEDTTGQLRLFTDEE